MWYCIYIPLLSIINFTHFADATLKTIRIFRVRGREIARYIVLFATRYLRNVRTSYAVCSHSSKYSRTMQHEVVFLGVVFPVVSPRDRAIQFSRACIALRRGSAILPNDQNPPPKGQHSSERRVNLTNRTRGSATPQHWPIEILYDMSIRMVHSHVREDAL